jgi:DNA repair protein RecN (Recombination protein N)
LDIFSISVTGALCFLSGEDNLLLELRVKDLGIIEEIIWSLGDGLNVITGETGAGKSLVIDAVETLLGGKAGEEDIRSGADRAIIEGVFRIPEGEKLDRFGELLAEKGLESDEETLVMYCELRRGGRAVLRVNGQAVTKGVLQQIEHFLIDIHAQSEHLSLLDKKRHLELLDAYAHTTELRKSFGAKAGELYRAEQELKALAEEEKDRARREEFLRFQLDEIKSAELKEGEDEEVERERNILASCEKLKAFSYEAYQALYEADASNYSASARDRLNEAVQAMKSLVELDPTLKPQVDFLEETLYGLEEAARDIRSYGDKLECDPQRQEEVESRLESIRNLKRKYGQTIPEIFDYMQNAERELEGISHYSERRSELEEQCRRLREEMGQMAAELSRARTEAQKKLVAEVSRELHDLDMAQVQFEVNITQSKSQEGLALPDGETYAFNNDGIDDVEFMASTNPGESLKPLARIASTGEISRFMLALKGVLSEADSTPVLVFDEIDIGVGGRSGEIIGKKLWTLARDRQVICVTHLPQIAAFADAHYRVRKEVYGERTMSRLEALQGESRIGELTTMLAGPQYTDASLDSARELVQKAGAWKESRRKVN